MLAVKEKIKTFTLEVAQEKEIGQSLWILLDNNRGKFRIGAIYAPQENVIILANNVQCIIILANRFPLPKK